MKTGLQVKVIFMLLLFAISGSSISVMAQGMEVKGVVIDTSTEEPLIGATVRVKDSTIADATNIDGEFTLKGVGDKATLIASYVGYKTQEVKLGGRSVIEIRMTEDSSLLDEVVVVGYGTMDKKEVTSTVAHISSEDFLASSSLDPTMMIQGKVPGVSITKIVCATSTAADFCGKSACWARTRRQKNTCGTAAPTM